MSTPLRVAWLGHHSAVGGDGLLTYSREMVQGLRARGARVFFVHHGPAAPEADDRIALKSLRSGHRYIISSPRTKRRIADLIKREHIDVVHASLSFSPSIDFGLPDLCHELGVPVVATFHVPFDSRPSVWSATSSAIYRVYSQSLAAYDRVIIFSEAQRSLLTQYGVPDPSVAVLPNGVDIAKYAPGHSSFKASLKATTLIGYLGRIDPEKNVDALARAFLDLGPYEGSHLVIVGGGSDRRRLERRYAGPQVHFTGQVSDEEQRIAMLRGLDVFVLPSTVEGLSLSLLEAMACGVATIATDVGSDGEALEGAGLVLDPRELDGQLRLALRTLLDFPDFRHELGRRARERAALRYSLDRNLDRLLSIYEELGRAYTTRPALVNR
ncbi:MAG TPA: glycosyltransferase family 4 protein [Candidatus Limnocylindrales bacterium]|nr:glycosyltransferase family 4 protein [Candidatus Limnocylindrales bacterium]